MDPAGRPIDERTWIIVPFENVTRAADIDWLREASVTWETPRARNSRCASRAT